MEKYINEWVSLASMTSETLVALFERLQIVPSSYTKRVMALDPHATLEETLGEDASVEFYVATALGDCRNIPLGFLQAELASKDLKNAGYTRLAAVSKNMAEGRLAAYVSLYGAENVVEITDGTFDGGT